ncbi:SusC/RagA family TonB-linked outer membrane protein [Puteibacter caeruleilacunae]|nr:SusC/RagA family TonB-linked outer membrane protein [Puteibacter caeruleilacunae]
MNKILYAITAFLMLALNAIGQEALNGVIKNSQGKPLAGIKVLEVGKSSNNCISNEDGIFVLDVEPGAYIQIQTAGGIRKQVKALNTTMEVVLDKQDDAFIDMGLLGKSRGDMTQAVSTIDKDLIAKSATMQLDNALYGLVAGLYAKQNVGWQETASLNIRGNGGLGTGEPLVIVDGFPRELSTVSLEEVESVQILKDAAGTALWGANGANGVILINTKRGDYTSFNIDVNYRHGINFAINEPEMADGLTYIEAQEEALYYDGLPSQYDIEEWKNVAATGDQDLYPNVEWVKEATRNISHSNQFNLSLRGGGKKTRYYSMVEYQNSFGILNETYTEYSDRYDSQLHNYKLNLRMNLDVDIHPGTQLKFGVFGRIEEDNRPNTEIEKIFKNLYKVPAIAFPIKTASGEWGSNNLFKMNPIAEIADVGFVKDNSRFLTADLKLTQDLSSFINGLNAEVAVAYDNFAIFREVGSKSYVYEINYLSGEGNKESEQFGTNSTLQITDSGLYAQQIRANFQAQLGYDRIFNDHHITGKVGYRQWMDEEFGRNMANYRQSILSSAGYNYKGKYMLDVVANYFGVSKLLDGDRFRFYPAVSAAWNIAKESFMEDANAIDLLKLRMSWGKSALDNNLVYGLGKYYWSGASGYPFGESLTVVRGIKESRLPLNGLDPETSQMVNVGIDLDMFKNLTFSIDAYHDRRTDILVTNHKTSDMLGVNLSKSDIGEVSRSGVEMNLGWYQQKKDFRYKINANLALNDSKIDENGEAFMPYDYLYRKGHKVGQYFGLEAIGYFNDQADIENSPEQTFSVVRPGDVKYKDQNNDGKIDSKDRIAIGKSTTVPEMLFALNFGVEYKGFGVDAVFQGVSGITKVLNVSSIHQPLKKGKSNISTWYLEDKVRWTEETKDIANAPRLSTLENANNYQGSTQWIKDGSFIKLRNLNVYYNFPENLAQKLKVKNLQIYARAQNVFSIDKIKYFNCEDVTMGYPDMFSCYVGLNIKLK